MILLPCPWCGPRDAAEFHHLGEAVPRPDPSTTTPQEWRAYLYERDNPCGWVTETWYHRMGCRRVVTLRRHTLTNEVVVAPPAQPAQPAQPAAPGDRGEPGKDHENDRKEEDAPAAAATEPPRVGAAGRSQGGEPA